jgi:hypothetical protein
MPTRLLAVMALFILGIAKVEMVPGDSIGNDPTKQAVCEERSEAQFKGATVVPFEIDKNFVARSRGLVPGFQGHSDTTFIAIQNGTGIALLIDCFVNSGTGQYGPEGSQSENNLWHLVKPHQFDPSIKSPAGNAIAIDRCREVARTKINRPNFDHSSVSGGAVEVNVTRGVRFPVGIDIAGVKAQRYDVIVAGTALYKSSGPDMVAVDFTCLLSPMLEIKALQIK